MIISNMAGANLGLIPDIVSKDPSKGMVQNIADHYVGGALELMTERHGKIDRKDMTYHYPGDRPWPCLAIIKRHDEELYFYRSSFVLVIDDIGALWWGRMD